MAEKWCEVEEEDLLRAVQASDVLECRRVYKVDLCIDVGKRSASLRFWIGNVDSEPLYRDERICW